MDNQHILNEVKRVYGRRHGRPLSPSRQKAFEDIYPQVEISEDTLTEQGDLNPLSIFHCHPEGLVPEGSEILRSAQDDKKVVLEIGFGNGERLAEAMRRNPEYHYLGAEPFLNGMSAFLKDIADNLPLTRSRIPLDHPLPRGEREEAAQQHQGEGGKPRVRVLMDDALRIVNSLTDESIDEIYILNPDPWHKARHHKRRIVRSETLPAYHRILKPGGKLIMTTDVVPLADWMQTETEIFGKFNWCAEQPADWQTPPENWIPTRYETKKAKGASKMTYLIYKKP